ncbi:MAG: LbtU family siderophore porin [Desulfobulbaceae bacterium]|nr:LbtU family siderophore porin [Desulfobulbaceae bacterium]HIJ79765.1 LbtU family siderophore porin [Deltaproteobacteria bacterium]
MKKRMVAAAALFSLAIIVPGGAAAELPAEVVQQIRELAEQNQKIVAQNRLLIERIEKLEQAVAENREAAGEVNSQLADYDGSLLQKINERVTLSGLVEVEGAVTDDFNGTNTSDLALATVELGLDAEISQWSSAHLLLKYEDGASGLGVDEGTITLGNLDNYPVYLTVGKMYVPFGNYTSNMISDPLTLNLGESNEDVIQLGFEANGFYGALYAFNGEVEETGRDNLVREVGASLGYLYANDEHALDLGVDWLNNIADSDGLSGYLMAAPPEGAGLTEIADQVNGIAAHLLYNYGPYSLIGEYVAATEAFAASELAYNGGGAKPKAWNVEVGYTSELMGKETTLALGYQGSDQAVDLGLPEKRYLAAVSMGIIDNTSLALEYIHDEDYSVANGGTDNDAETVTMQLGVEF